jgi:dipeptidyl-peptidase-3
LGITNWLIEHQLVSVEEVKDADGKIVNAYVRVDRERVLKEGKAVMG